MRKYEGTKPALDCYVFRKLLTRKFKTDNKLLHNNLPFAELPALQLPISDELEMVVLLESIVLANWKYWLGGNQIESNSQRNKFNPHRRAVDKDQVFQVCITPTTAESFQINLMVLLDK